MQFLFLGGKYFSSSLPLLMSFLGFILFFFLGSASVRGVMKLPENKAIPAVIMFGDSIVDTGNNNNLQTIFKVNFPPYGKDFKGGIPTGRFCDGKVPSDLFVEELGIKELLPPYLDPTLSIEDLKTGVNFASGGAGYDPLTSELAAVISMSDQIVLFKEYIAKVKALAGERTANAILTKGLFIVVQGSNDITNTYFNNPIRKFHYNPDSYTDLMLNSASSFVQDLYSLGARRIGVFGVPPLGCLPSQRTLVGGKERNCAENYNEVAQLFNKKLSAELNYLNTKFPHASMVYIDAYNLPMELINTPHKYGFEISNRGCCGTGIIEVAFLCKSTCSDVYDYVFWDSFHLTEKAYRVIVRNVINKNLNSLICNDSTC